MKLLIETLDNVETLVENTINGRDYFIEGIFMQAEVRNGNGRIYPRNILEKQVSEYQSLINDKRALSELGHPSTPTPSINYANVSHLITDLRMEGCNVVGKAKILTNLPMGSIAKALIDEGVRLGVSSRGLGSVTAKNGSNFVQNDFVLKAIDIVHEPSAPNAFVNSVNEGLDWEFIDNEWKLVKTNTLDEELFIESLENYINNLLIS